MEHAQLEQLVKRVTGRALAERGRCAASPDPVAPTRPAGVHVSVAPCDGPERPAAGEEPRERRPGRPLVTAACLRETPAGGAFRVPQGAIVTDLAEEEAHRRGIRLVRGGADAGPRLVAVACDHGGFEMKGAVLEWVRELGCRALDLGTHDESPVDYPDQAEKVARAVAEGRAALGIAIDGAGIGSAIAANKVPGVRAATCWDERSARNAREHNYANVLSIGGRMLAPSAAHAIVRAFLATPEGAERHGRRVAKISALEERSLRAGSEVAP